MKEALCCSAVLAFALGLLASCYSWAAEPDRALDAESYNQWKKARGAAQATAASEIRAPTGFTVELLRSAQAGEGSWVAMTFDPDGRIIIAREERGLLRLNLSPSAVEVIDDTLREVRGLLFAHGSLYANANNARALVRLRDSDGDGHFEEKRTLRETPGGVGHGRNQLALGPDGLIYSIHGDDVRAPAGGFSPESPFAHWAEEKLLSLPWDRHLSNSGVALPGGHLVRTDPDGKSWEIVCGGLRNPFGIAFNGDGEAFTYDADMEWDVGLPWYHPTRVLHLVSGADYGWRGGTRPLPVWLPDTRPTVVDIGKGSPTAVGFGARSRWPEPWRSMLFAMDWAYGRIHAVTLTPTGASYTGRSGIFVEGRPLNVASFEFGPDGEMYFVTGGRSTQSGLYRVRWTGGSDAAVKSDAPVDDTAQSTRALRRQLERFHGRQNPTAIATAWPHLGSSDSWIRHAARVAIESQVLGEWRDRALAENDITSALEAAIALARIGGVQSHPAVLEKLRTFDLRKLNADQQITWLRVLELSSVRTAGGEAARFLPTLEAAYPASDSRVNRMLCDLLVSYGSAAVVEKTVPLLSRASAQEEQLHYLFALGVARRGWSPDSRREWLSALRRAKTTAIGGHTLGENLAYVRAEFTTALAPEETSALAAELAALDHAAPPPTPAATPRAFVHAWTIEDLAPALADRSPRDLQRGARLFIEAGCATCHRVGTEGGTSGPDLGDVGRRFDQHALLESIVEPSRVIAEQYRTVFITLPAGVIVSGRVLGEDDASLLINTNTVDVDRQRRIARKEIAKVDTFSPMPPGLLNTLSKDEVLDLLAWLAAAR